MSSLNEKAAKRPTATTTNTVQPSARILTVQRAIVASVLYGIAGLLQKYLLDIWTDLYTTKPPRPTIAGTIPEIVPPPEGLALWIFFFIIFGTMDILRQWVIKAAEL